jgi:hypothetical protein
MTCDSRDRHVLECVLWNAVHAACPCRRVSASGGCVRVRVRVRVRACFLGWAVHVLVCVRVCLCTRMQEQKGCACE